MREAARMYRGSLAIRVPRVIPALCTAEITAMSEETGVKVTDAFRRSPIRRARIAAQLIEALIATPLFSGQQTSTFHADPHAGNLLYDEANRELVVLDWALAEKLTLSTRRDLILLAIMMLLGNRGRRAPRDPRPAPAGYRTAADGRTHRRPRRRRILRPASPKTVRRASSTPCGCWTISPCRASISTRRCFCFAKACLRWTACSRDVAGSEVRIDREIALQFLTRWAASFGLFYSPLTMKDFFAIEWNALRYSARALKRRLAGETGRHSK